MFSTPLLCVIFRIHLFLLWSLSFLTLWFQLNLCVNPHSQTHTPHHKIQDVGRQHRLLSLLLVLGYQNMPALLWLELFCHSDILVPDTKLRRALALGSAYLDAMIPLSCCLKVLRLFYPEKFKRAEEETSISPQAPHSQNSHIGAPGILSFLLETLLQGLCGVVLCRGTFLLLVLYHHPDRLDFLL